MNISACRAIRRLHGPLSEPKVTPIIVIIGSFVAEHDLDLGIKQLMQALFLAVVECGSKLGTVLFSPDLDFGVFSDNLRGSINVRAGRT